MIVHASDSSDYLGYDDATIMFFVDWGIIIN